MRHSTHSLPLASVSEAPHFPRPGPPREARGPGLRFLALNRARSRGGRPGGQGRRRGMPAVHGGDGGGGPGGTRRQRAAAEREETARTR